MADPIPQVPLPGPGDQPLPPFQPPEPSWPGAVPWLPDPTLPYAPQDPGDYVPETPAAPGAEPTSPGSPSAPQPLTWSPDTGAFPQLEWGGITLYRNARKASRLARDAELLARRVGKQAMRGAWDFLRAAGSRIYFGPAPVAPPPPPPPVNPIMVRPGWYGPIEGAISRVPAAAPWIAGVLAMVYSKPAGGPAPLPGPGQPGWGNPSDLALSRQLVANQLAREKRAFDQQQQRLAGERDLQQRLESGGLPPGNEIRLPPQDYGRPSARPPSMLERAIEDYLPGPLRDAIERSRRGQGISQTPSTRQGSSSTSSGRELGVPGDLGVGPTAPAPTAPAPSTAGSQNVTPAGSPRRLQYPGAIIFGAAGFAVFNLVALHRSGGGGQRAFPGVLPGETAAPIAPGATIATPPATSVSPIPAFYAQSVGGTAGGYCTPQPRGPRRKCLERAPVNWRSGRNKGKAAGTKCVRYAQRAS